jgi:hypothetical protein
MRNVGRFPPVRRPLVAAITLVLALSVALAPVAGGSGSTASEVSTGTASPFLLRGRQQVVGPWKRYLWLKYSKFDIVRFSVCGAWNQAISPTCSVAQGNKLPEGATLKLEQRIGSAKRPSWRTVGVSFEPTLQASLSNTVSKNRVGQVAYRVTLRSLTNRVLRASNVFKVFWTR